MTSSLVGVGAVLGLTTLTSAGSAINLGAVMHSKSHSVNRHLTRAQKYRANRGGFLDQARWGLLTVYPATRRPRRFRWSETLGSTPATRVP